MGCKALTCDVCESVAHVFVEGTNEAYCSVRHYLEAAAPVFGELLADDIGQGNGSECWNHDCTTSCPGNEKEAFVEAVLSFPKA